MLPMFQFRERVIAEHQEDGDEVKILAVLFNKTDTPGNDAVLL